MRISKLVKSFSDIFIALLLLLPTMMAILALSIVIVAKNPGCPYYLQTRIGKSGREFRIYKLRSMVKDADCLEDALSQKDLEEYRKEYKLKDDPRLIGWSEAKDKRKCLGAILRETALDELPQIIFNVLIFRNMSFVGPRPLIREELDKYYTPEERERLLSVKPGITGYWQAYGRNRIGYANHKRQEMELEYVSKRTLLFDAKIIFQTAFHYISRLRAL